MTSHHDTPAPRHNDAGVHDSQSMGRDSELVLAQAAIGRSFLMLLRDNAGGTFDIDNVRHAVTTVHKGMAATGTGPEAAAHALAARLLTERNRSGVLARRSSPGKNT